MSKPQWQPPDGRFAAFAPPGLRVYRLAPGIFGTVFQRTTKGKTDWVGQVYGKQLPNGFVSEEDARAAVERQLGEYVRQAAVRLGLIEGGEG